MNADSRRVCSDLKTAVANLHASSTEGFEGLVRDAYREATGVSLRLQKSGTQHGADAVPGNDGDGILTGIEAKRYRDTTRLRLDELKAKLIDAATRGNNPIELWILTASREIAGDDARELRRIADEQGLGMLVLDWRADNDPTAPLPLLLSLAPGAVRQHLGNSLADALPVLHTHPEYGSQSTSLLKELRQPDMGLSHAIIAVRDRIAETLSTRENAKARLQNPVDMEAPDCVWISRDSLCKNIRRWQQDAATTPVCGLTGEEGTGKTWLMFDWWRQETEGESPPLILWFAARDVAAPSLSGILGAALAKWVATPKKDVAFWTARVDLWRQVHGSASGPPVIWLMLDGVNEGSAQDDVVRALSEAIAPEWRGRIGILLSDRPGHWQDKLLSGEVLERPARGITVPRFSNSELDNLLSRHGKDRSKFSPEVLDIMRWPSWFAVAAELFNRDDDWSAHSPEQLMIRYWQHKLRDRGKVSTIGDPAFRDFIADLGNKAKTTVNAASPLSRAALKKLLADASGASEQEVMNALDDLTSGLWMKDTGNKRFAVDKKVLPFAIGLALINELRGSAGFEGADSACEQFLGPLESQSIGTDIFGATISLTFVDTSFPDHAKSALVERWIRGHNFTNKHFQLLWRAGASAPDLFFSIAEHLWLQGATRHSVDDILIKGLANIARDSGKMDKVLAFAAKWMSTYWDDPLEGEAIGHNPTPQEKEAAAQATAARVGILREQLGEQRFAAIDLRRSDNGFGASWLCHRIFSLCTYLKRERQSDIWRGWVFSRAVMDHPLHYEELAWSLRLNTEDGRRAPQAVLQTAEKLLALSADMLQPYILRLLSAEAGYQSMAKLAELGGVPSSQGAFRSVEHATVEGGTVRLPRKSRTEGQVAFALSRFALDPDLNITKYRKSQLASFAKTFPVEELSVSLDRTSQDLELERAEAALARWAPVALAELHRRWFATLSDREDEDALLGFALGLTNLLVLMPATTQKAITAALVRRMAQTDRANVNQIDRAFWAAAIFDRSPSTQVKVWKDIGAPENVPKDFESLMRPASGALLRRVERELDPAKDKGRLASWLRYLFAADSKAWPQGCEVLSRLFDHEDGTVRWLAFSVALIIDEGRLADRLRRAGWRASRDKSVEENYWGSCLLIQATTPSTAEEIYERIDKQWCDALWAKLKYAPRYRYLFGDFLASSVNHECNPPKRRRLLEYRCSPEAATLELLKQDRESVVSLADRLFDQKFGSSFLAEQWPRRQLLKAFFQEDPGNAARYLLKLEQQWDAFIGKSDTYEGIAFSGQDHAAVDMLRGMAIHRATNDWKLITLAASIARYDKTTWCVDWIRRTIVDPVCSGDVARAVTLAGFLAPCPATDALWKNELGEPPAGGWVERVHSNARRRTESAAHALHWLEQIFEARTDTDFFATWRLFALCADYRMIPVAAARMRERPETMNPRHSNFIDFNWKHIIDRTKREKNALERTLFGTPIGLRNALPWAR